MRRKPSRLDAWTVFTLIILVGFLIALGPVGKDLLHNPVKTGIPTDPYAEYFNRLRYLLIAVCVIVAAL